LGIIIHDKSAAAAASSVATVEMVAVSKVKLHFSAVLGI
jgi:hypothetical protein